MCEMGAHGGGRGCVHVACCVSGLSSRTGTLYGMVVTVGWRRLMFVQMGYDI